MEIKKQVFLTEFMFKIMALINSNWIFNKIDYLRLFIFQRAVQIKDVMAISEGETLIVH